MNTLSQKAPVAVIGGGPAGLIAAEKLALAGIKVTVYEQRPSVGRKFLMAGRGGLNLTHGEDTALFLARYGMGGPYLQPALDAFSPAMLRQWCEDLGQPTFIGSSGRIFPKAMKASPLLRAWIARLESLGITILTRYRWTGWNRAGNLTFLNPDQHPVTSQADAALLALGGATWPRLGSDGHWTGLLRDRGVALTPFRPANCGFNVAWSPVFRDKFAGLPIKPVILSFNGTSLQGEITITRNGVEGGGIYALSAPLRDHIERHGHAVLTLDLRPGLKAGDLERRLSAPRGRLSLSNYLRKAAGLSPAVVGLLREHSNIPSAPAALSTLVKTYPLRLSGTAPIAGAISSAGGIRFDALDDHFMLKALPGTFAAGEMLDWEAPTGGYLLQACFSTGIMAASGLVDWLTNQAAS